MAHLLTIREACAFLRISKSKLDELMREQRIGRYKDGRNVTFSIEQHLLPYLKSIEIPVAEAQSQAADRPAKTVAPKGGTFRKVVKLRRVS